MIDQIKNEFTAQKAYEEWSKSEEADFVINLVNEVGAGGGSVKPEDVEPIVEKYVDEYTKGITKISGKSCTVKNIEKGEKNSTIVTFAWTDDASGDEKTTKVTIPGGTDGKGIKSILSTREADSTKVTVTFTDDTDSVFHIQDGNGISAINVVDDGKGGHKITIYTDKSSTSGKTFTVKDGVGIKDITNSKNAKGGVDIKVELTDGTIKKATIDKANGMVSGTIVAATGVYGIPNTTVGDLYVNTKTCDYFERTDTMYDGTKIVEREDYWVLRGNLKGKDGTGAYDTWLEIPGNEGKTKAEFIEAISGEGMAVIRVNRKPSIKDKGVIINAWYVYQLHDEEKAKNLQLSYNTAYVELAKFNNLKKGKYYIYVPKGGKTVFLSFELPDDITDQFMMTAQIKDLTANLTATQVDFHYTAGYDHFLSLEATESTTVPAGCTLIDTPFITLAQAIKTNTSWLRKTNSFKTYTTAGQYALFNGISYWVFDIERDMPTGWETVYPGGLCVLFNEAQMRAWVCGINAKNEITPLGRVWGAPVTVMPEVPAGATLATLELTDLGMWWQTCYAGSNYENASDVTMQMGTSLTGVVTKPELLEIVGSEVLTTEKTTLKGAINEIDAIVRRGTTTLTTAADNLVGAVNELHEQIDAVYPQVNEHTTKIRDIEEELKGTTGKLLTSDSVLKSGDGWLASDAKLPTSASVQRFINNTMIYGGDIDSTADKTKAASVGAVLNLSEAIKKKIPTFELKDGILTITVE